MAWGGENTDWRSAVEQVEDSDGGVSLGMPSDVITSSGRMVQIVSRRVSPAVVIRAVVREFVKLDVSFDVGNCPTGRCSGNSRNVRVIQPYASGVWIPQIRVTC